MTRTLLTVLALAGAASAASAATVMETREPGGGIAKMTVEGRYARMQSEEHNYVLIDLTQGKFYGVDLGARHIIDMSAPPPPDPNFKPEQRPAVHAVLVDKGEGPIIAGFPTRHYQITAEGRICSDTFLSAQAMEEGDMRGFMEGFQRFYQQQKEAYVQAGADYDACEEAQDVAWDKYLEYGMPLKTVDLDGYMRQEVVALRTGVSVEKGYFDLPELPIITLEQFLQGDRDQEVEPEDLE